MFAFKITLLKDFFAVTAQPCVSNFDLAGTSRRCLRRSFRPPFSKGGADPTRGALVASAEAKLLLRHFFFAKLFSLGLGCQRKKRTNSYDKQNGVSLSTYAFFVLNIRFSFVTVGAKEKLGKRKRRGLFRLCGGDQRSARWIGAAF